MTKFYLLYSVLLTAFANVSTIFNFPSLNFLADVVLSTFELRYSIYILSDDSRITWTTNIVIQELNLAHVYCQPMHIPRKMEKDVYKDGYIISSGDIDYIKSMFAGKTIDDFQFQTRTRVLIFFQDYYNFNTSPFVEAAFDRGVDVIAVTGASDVFTLYVLEALKEWSGMDFMQKINRDDTLRTHWHRRSANISVFSVFRQEIIASFPEAVDIEKFRYTWQPVVREGITFRVAAYDCAPFIIANQDLSVDDGIDVRIFAQIMKRFPYNILVLKNSKEGSGSFKAMRNAVSNREFDATACGHWQNPNKSWDMSYPYMDSCATFLVPRPTLRPDLLLVFQPFQVSLWITILCTSIIAAVIIFKVSFIDREDMYGNFSLCIVDVIRMDTLGALPFFNRVNGRLRFILTTWIVGSLLVCTTYSSGYTSLLAFPGYTKPINTFDDMISQGVTWGAFETTLRDLLENSPRKLMRQIANLFRLEENITMRNVFVTSRKHSVIAKIMPGHYIIQAEHILPQYRSYLKVLNECANIFQVVFVVQDNSPFRLFLNAGIQRLQEHGIIICWYNQIRYKYNYHFMEEFYPPFERVGEGFVQLTYSKIEGALYILVAGLSISTVTFVFEMLRPVCFA